MKTIKYISLALLASVLLINAEAQKINAEKAKAGTDKLDRTIRPVAGTAAVIQLKKPETFTMDNGLKVFVVENHKTAKVSFSIMLNLQPTTEGDKTGTSAFTGQMLGTATEKRTKDQINEEVDFLGASLNTSGGGISGGCLKKHLPKYMDIFSDVLLNPVFNQEELDKLKTQNISNLASNKTSPDAMAANVQAVVVYGKNHPYGEVMTEANVENITLEDCKKYYSDYFKPNVGYLAIVGDVTLAEAKELCNKYFATWKNGDVPKSYIPPVQSPTKNTVCFVDKPGAVQSTVHITYPVDLKPGSEDAIKVSVMDDILGGSFSARLFRNLRETYNFTYGAYSDLSADKYIGNFDASADVRTEATDSALVQFFYEIKRMRDEPVTKEELQGVINNLTGKFAIGLEQPGTIARYAMNIDRYGLSADYYANYLTALSMVTIEDVQAMAKKYLKPDACYIVVVGDKEKIAKSVSKYSTDGKIKYYDSYGNDFIDLKKMPEGVDGWKVMENYVAALGGKAVLTKVKSMKITMAGTTQGFALEQTIIKGSGKYKMTFGSGPQIFASSVFDGTAGYNANMQTGKKDFTADEIAEMKINAMMFPEMTYKELGYTITALGVDKVDEKDAYKVEITNPKGEKHYEWFDVADGFQVMTQQTEEGNTVTMKYSDYKEITAKKIKVKFPHKVSLVQEGLSLEMTAKEILVNPKLDAELFSTK